MGDPSGVVQSNSTAAGMIPAQPMPGMPQGPGNMMNNPQVGMSMGGGMPQPGGLDTANPRSPYGDPVFDQETYAKTGTVGFTDPSGMQQNMIPGRLYNSTPFNTQQQPFEDTMKMLEPMHLAQEASSRAEKLYGPGEVPSYQVGPLGMMGTPVEIATNAPNPGAFPGNMPTADPNQLGLQGVPDVQAAVASQGMNTGRGGGRNKPAKGA